MLTGRLFSQRLDRSKPLWELWLVQGLEDNRFALINKTHHCLVDGVSGVDITTVLFDTAPTPMPVGAEPWTPRPEPSDAQLVAKGIEGIARFPVRAARRAASAVRHPGETLDELREGAEGLGSIAWKFANPPPPTPLNVPIGPHRRVRWVRMPLADLKAIKNELGGTVNDVFLAVVSGALAATLKRRGVRTEGLELRGIVPVSVRGDDQRGALGNRITAMLGPLPVYAADARTRLRIVTEAMKGLKESKQAVGAEALTRLQDFAPPTILAQASRLNFSARAYNLLVTNVPGPQFPLYLIGREMEELTPVPFLAPERALAVAIMSYNGSVTIGLMGDYDAMADLDEFGEDVESAVAELLEVSREATAATTASGSESSQTSVTRTTE
jgi:WS/DGAT/MGAT family acyltransferase